MVGRVGRGGYKTLLPWNSTLTDGTS